MRKVFAVVLLFVIALGGCSNPTDTVIPSDVSTWDEKLGPVVQRLKGEDRRLFVEYITRMKLVAGSEIAIAAGESLPFGVTVAQAIEEQRKRNQMLTQINNAVRVTFLGKREHQASYESGDFDDIQEIDIGIENISDKDIVGVSGKLKFVDVFGEVVGAVKFRVSQKIQPGEAYKWVGERKHYNLIESHRAVWNLEEGKYSTRFNLETVVFADGTKLVMPE